MKRSKLIIPVIIAFAATLIILIIWRIGFYAPEAKQVERDVKLAEKTVGPKAKAEELLQQIKDGADFAELARVNSSCPSAAKGGDLGFGEKSDPNSGRRGTWVAPFEKAAFELEVGQVSNIVETQFGYHIIKVTDRKEAGVITFEQAKDDILKLLTQTKQAELAREYIESLKAEANIVYPPGKEPKADKTPVKVIRPPKQAEQNKEVSADSNTAVEPKDGTKQAPVSPEAATEPEDKTVVE